MREWYRLNEARESWVFLRIELVERNGELDEWELGVGNMNHLLRTTACDRDEVADEGELLRRLGREVPHGIGSDGILITRDAEIVAQLRRRLIANDAVITPTLRGLRHVPLDEIADEYFAGHLPPVQDTVSSSDGDRNRLASGVPTHASIETLWRMWTQIVPVIPSQALTERRL
jgi:hypothetical protein